MGGNKKELLIGDSFARYCVIILFGICCLLKYDVMAEIMGPTFKKKRYSTAICYQKWSVLNLKSQFRDIVFHILITDNEILKIFMF